MSDAPRIHEFESLEKLVDRLRDDFVNKNLFRQILDAFLNKYQFDLPSLLTEAATPETV